MLSYNQHIKFVLLPDMNVFIEKLIICQRSSLYVCTIQKYLKIWSNYSYLILFHVPSWADFHMSDSKRNDSFKPHHNPQITILILL